MSGLTLKFVRGDGRTFAMDGGVFGLVSATGLDEANVEVYTQKAAVGDGDIVTGQRVGSRTLEFTAKARNASLNEVLRRAVTSFFTANQTYAVYVSRYGSKRFAADCRLSGAEVSTDALLKPITLKLSFLMPEGYFCSVDSFGKNIAGIVPRCGYPYAARAGVGRICGVYAYAQTVALENDGDAEAYCKAVFSARGSVQNPRLNTGGNFVRVLCAMERDDVLIVDGRTRAVTLNGANVSAYLDKQSRFDGIVFGLGTNTVGFIADVGANVLDVYVYYNKRFMGA